MLPGAESAGWPDEPALDETKRPFWRTRLSAVRKAFPRPGDDALSREEPGRSGARQSSPAPLYVAAPPPPPTNGSPLFDTRLARDVRRLLETLGATRESVATALEVAGVRAAPRDSERSPINLFLGAVIGAHPDVKCVRTDGEAVIVDLRSWWRPTVAVPLPQAVHDFRVAFDAGCYPALLRDEFPDDVDRPHGPDAERAD